MVLSDHRRPARETTAESEEDMDTASGTVMAREQAPAKMEAMAAGHIAEEAV